MEAPVFEKGYPSYKAVNGKETEMKLSDIKNKFGEGTDFDLSLIHI